MNALFNRIRQIYQNYGLVTLIRRALKFIVSFLFEYKKFYLFVHKVVKLNNESDWIPRIDNINMKILKATDDLDKLSEEGLDLSQVNIDQTVRRLTNGAFALLIFANSQLVYKSWEAFSEKAKNTFNDYPYKVNFNGGEVCGGDIWTNPKYRKKGLHAYASYKWEELLVERGIIRLKWIVDANNVIGQKATDVFGENKVYAKARYLRIFGLKFWKETLIE